MTSAARLNGEGHVREPDLVQTFWLKMMPSAGKLVKILTVNYQFETFKDNQAYRYRTKILDSLLFKIIFAWKKSTGSCFYARFTLKYDPVLESTPIIQPWHVRV